ncbi:Mannosyl-D-glycerate transport/metabolism system repressor MngR [Roseivivax jejudonensis]|uniref:Mannosyl-D-glycerate transport/metabolism system repressor MngR n=1 Tax=Roseivivax jejudonensis TaxID=1529041 RepID=A0A1X7A2G8_9RHOB|nr:GntR family transcriptional regulator [Roseivivax jejudonensis]SLN68729.1 Mannosyl-D-glycerate transport/metabolism system repressor MngR [Roseivivax jejudonensis]
MTDRHALPLYVQLSEMLIREIRAGRYVDGERLPPEREMAAALGASVGTLRKALQDLTDKGMLERRQGSGNYVRATPDAKSVYAFFRVELKDSEPGLPRADLLSIDARPGDEAPPQLSGARRAYRIRRLRSLDRVPAVLEEIWLDGRFADAIAPEDLSESLYLFYRERLGLWIGRVEDRLTTGTVPDWAPPSFGAAPGATALLATRRGWSQEGTLAEVSLNWIDTGVAAYVSRHG